MMEACAAKAERGVAPNKTSAAAAMVKWREKITCSSLKRQDVNRRRSVGNPRKTGTLTYSGKLTVARSP